MHAMKFGCLICAGVEFLSLIIDPYHFLLTVWYQSSRLVGPACVSKELFRAQPLMKKWRIYVYIYKTAMYGRSHVKVQEADGETMRRYSMLLRSS